MNPSTPYKKATPLCLILFALGCVALLPDAQAVDPPPDGGYPGGDTAEDLNAPFSPTIAVHNTAYGDGALENNQGSNNSAFGYAALRRNTFGNQNTATGALTLNNNNVGSRNTATGFQALQNNTTGVDNTATGFDALRFNTIGTDNTATGSLALYSNTRGVSNTATGFGTLSSNTTGSNNTAIGFRAGTNSTTGENNIYIGAGMLGVGGESNHTYVRNLNITSVSGGGADTVTVDLGTGLIGHLSSSRRYKQNIKPMDNTSEALYRFAQLHFVTKRILIGPSHPPLASLLRTWLR